MLGPEGMARLEAVRPPSLGIPLVLPAPQSHRVRQASARTPANDTTKATMARASGLPGKDRGPKGGSAEDLEAELDYNTERTNAQGFIPQSVGGFDQDETGI